MDLILLTISREAEIPEWWHTMARALGVSFSLWQPAPEAGYVEAVLDDTLRTYHDIFTRTIDDDPYLLRLDDDEWLTEAAAAWLRTGDFASAPIWKFPRIHRWGDGTQWVDHPQLFPDWQTRLSRLSLAGGRGVIHAGSPHGGGDVVPDLCAIVHDKFLKPIEERRRIAAAYDAVMEGAGTGGFKVFNLPEEVIDVITLHEFTEAPSWRPR